MDTPLVTPDRTPRAQLTLCACGTSLPDGAHRLCARDAAVHHSARVAKRANELLSRLHAVVLLGTLDGELRPLSA